MAKTASTETNTTPADIQKVDSKPQDILGQRLAGLKELFPEAFVEGRVDFAKLRMALGDVAEANGERYGLLWAGKADCFREIQTPTTAMLSSVREESVDFDINGNLFIEGCSKTAIIKTNTCLQMEQRSIELRLIWQVCTLKPSRK